MNVKIGAPEEDKSFYLWLEEDTETREPSIKLMSKHRGLTSLEGRFYPESRKGYLTNVGHFRSV